MSYKRKATLATVFIMAAISAIMFYGQGIHTWFWQLVTMGLAVDSYLQKKR